MSWVVLLIDKNCTPYVAKALEQFSHNEQYYCHLIVLLLCGEDKRTQAQDIPRAQQY
jgi:putative component of toxin-antitoxin plasmid stabilization module